MSLAKNKMFYVFDKADSETGACLCKPLDTRVCGLFNTLCRFFCIACDERLASFTEEDAVAKSNLC